jgi:hypothetical protein
MTGTSIAKEVRKKHAQFSPPFSWESALHSVIFSQP